MPDDIAGIQAIYGSGQGSVTPLGVPEPVAVELLGLWYFGRGGLEYFGDHRTGCRERI